MSVEKVRDLHQEDVLETIAQECFEERCEHDGACPITGTAPICGHCTYEMRQWEGDSYVQPVWWPCPTVKALDPESSSSEGSDRG